MHADDLTMIADATNAGQIQFRIDDSHWCLLRGERAVLYVALSEEGEDKITRIMSDIVSLASDLRALGYDTPEVTEPRHIDGWDYVVGTATIVPGTPLSTTDPDTWTHATTLALLAAATYRSDGTGIILNARLDDILLNETGVSGVQVLLPGPGEWMRDAALIEAGVRPEDRELGFAFLETLGITLSQEERDQARAFARDIVSQHRDER